MPRRYAALYDQLGFDAEGFSDHSDHLIATSREKEEAHANVVIKLIREQQPAVVHMFSNGGAWVWSDVLRIASLEAGGATRYCARIGDMCMQHPG